MNAPLAARFQPWMAHMPLLLSLALVLLIAYQLATATWAVVSPQADVGAGGSTAAPAATPPPDPEAIARRHLFGAADAVPGAVATVDAPETRLNLTLRGIAASGSREFARALIAGPDNQEKVYAVGAEVPGGARVHEIHEDHVLLNRRGALETLRLPKFGDGGDTVPPVAAQPVAAVAVDNLRNQAATDALVEVVRPQAVMVDGQLSGFRVYPGRDRRRFAELGLRAGDLVTAVNGMPLTDMAQSLEAMQALTGTGEVALTVRRGDETENITVTP